MVLFQYPSFIKIYLLVTGQQNFLLFNKNTIVWINNTFQYWYLEFGDDLIPTAMLRDHSIFSARIKPKRCSS